MLRDTQGCRNAMDPYHALHLPMQGGFETRPYLTRLCVPYRVRLGSVRFRSFIGLGSFGQIDWVRFVFAVSWGKVRFVIWSWVGVVSQFCGPGAFRDQVEVAMAWLGSGNGEDGRGKPAQ